MIYRFLFFILLLVYLNGCGKVGPLSLPDDKLNKSLITYPCEEACQKKLEDEKERQQSVIIQTN